MTRTDVPFSQIRTGGFCRVSPYALFADITYIRNETERDAIVDACFAVRGYVPVIDRHPKYGWVFHTLHGPELTWRKQCAEWFPQEAATRGTAERRIEDAICEHLRARGIAFRRQVVCRGGIADVVTAERVYEVKANLSHGLFRAIGQVLVYRAAIDPALEPVIIGRTVTRQSTSMAASVGVLVSDVDQAIRTNELR